jgi:GT2 family glycosyltransferase
MQSPTVLTICINYHNEEETIGFVRGVLRQEGDQAQTVIVVDNSVPPKTDNPLRRALDSDARISIMYPGRNLGYFGGAAWALRKYASRLGLPEWIIVSNTDICLVQPDFLAHLREFHSAAPHAIVAPAIYSELSKRDLNPYMRTRPTRSRMKRLKLLFRYLPVASTYHILAFAKAFLLKNYRNLRSATVARAGSVVNANQKTLLPQQIYAPHGSFVVFSRRYFESGGTLDHGVFLCGEEFFIAETARRLGLQVIYDPRLAVIHKEHATLGRYTSRRLLKFQREATHYVTDTFFSGSATKS